MNNVWLMQVLVGALAALCAVIFVYEIFKAKIQYAVIALAGSALFAFIWFVVEASLNAGDANATSTTAWFWLAAGALIIWAVLLVKDRLPKRQLDPNYGQVSSEYDPADA